MKIESPCVNICKLDECGICLGCFRSVQEIAQWSRMAEEEKALVITALVARRPKSDKIWEATSNE